MFTSNISGEETQLLNLNIQQHTFVHTSPNTGCVKNSQARFSNTDQISREMELVGGPRNWPPVTLSYSLSLPNVGSSRLSQALLLVKLRSDKEEEAHLQGHAPKSHFLKDKKATYWGGRGCFHGCCARPPSWRNCWSQESTHHLLKGSLTTDHRKFEFSDLEDFRIFSFDPISLLGGSIFW